MTQKIEAMAACDHCTEAGEDLRCYPINMLRRYEGKVICDQCFPYGDEAFRELPPVTLTDLC